MDQPNGQRNILTQLCVEMVNKGIFSNRFMELREVSGLTLSGEEFHIAHAMIQKIYRNPIYQKGYIFIH